MSRRRVLAWGIACLVLAALMMITSLAVAQEALPPEKLVMYMVGEKGVDVDLIMAEVNKKLKKDLNVTIELKTIPIPDVNVRYPLIFASGEEFDLVFSAGWCHYKQQAANGGFLELTDDLLKKHAPKTAAEIKEEMWKPVMVNGKKYLIPRTDYKYDPYVIVIRGDLREKYNLPEIKSLADYELYLDTIAKNERGILPYGDNNYTNCWLLASIMLNQANGWRVLTSAGSDLLHYKIDDRVGDQIFIREATPEYLAFAKKMVEWRKKGYWSNSAMIARGMPYEQFLVGKSASYIHRLENVLATYNNEVSKKHPEWKMEVYDATFGSKVDFSIPIAGMALSANTKKAERCLMVIELFRNDRSYYDLLQYGIKGRHYDLTPEGKTIPGPQAAGYGDLSFYGLRTAAFNRSPAATFPSYDEIRESAATRGNLHPLSMYSLEVENIKNEFAACKSIYDQYRPILNLGFNEDPEKTIQEYLAKMKAAGYDKILEEAKKQTVKFIAEY